MRNHIQAGHNIDVPAPSTVNSGDGVIIGALFGIASTDAEANETVAIAITGVYDLPKNAADDISVGDALYWDDATSEVTTTDTGAKIGVAVAAAIAPTAIARVRLNGSF
ncbi:MAG: DUF2190 family protein [Pseudomonadota bacterium]